MFGKTIFCALFAALLPIAAAAECAKEDRAAQRDLRTTHIELERSVERAASQLAAQALRLEALGLQADEIGAVPEAPVAPADGFGPGGELALDCDDPEAAAATLARARDGLAAYEAAVAAFVARLDERETALLELEDARAAEPPAGPSVSDGAPQPSPGAALPADGGPLVAENNPLLFQRVLTLPEARLVAAAGDAEGEPLPPFSVLYVFARSEVGGRSWAEVGRTPNAAPEGWVDEARALEWNNALVMKFTPRGKRNRVLFFDEARDLVDVITGFQVANEAKGFYRALDEGKLKDERFVAAEPATAVDYAKEPYLIPIIDHVDEFFDNGAPAILVKVASVSVDSPELVQRDEESFAPPPPVVADGKLPPGFRFEVMFVVDTTASMGPYIERARETIRAFYERIGSIPSEVSAAFGMVAYRDNLAHDPGVEYVVRTVQPLDPNASPRAILANLGTVKPSPRPTVDWREDALAALAEAIEGTTWSENSARLVILITDAGARDRGDALASRPDIGVRTIVEMAREKRVAIIPIHLITPEAERIDGDEIARARDQYREFDDTGVQGAAKYTAIDARNQGAFAREIAVMAQKFTDEIINAATEDVGVARAPEDNDGYLRSDERALGDAPPPRLGEIIAGEILRARLEALGVADAAAAPSFVSGWASNVDLVDPSIAALEFSVFLTRNQINALAQSVGVLVDAYVGSATSSGATGTSPGAFFDQLQLIAARTAADPGSVQADEKAAVREILPAFLDGLPYRSQVLRLDRGLWLAYSDSDRERFVDTLREKLGIYRRLYEQTENWVDFGAGDPALEAYPVALELLP